MYIKVNYLSKSECGSNEMEFQIRDKDTDIIIWENGKDKSLGEINSNYDNLSKQDITDIISDRDYTADDVGLEIDEDEAIEEYFWHKDLCDVIDDQFQDSDVIKYIEDSIKEGYSIKEFISEKTLVECMKDLGYKVEKEE